jgi:ubiquinone/menaquinone biosynthesis C-methylase UbiE
MTNDEIKERERQSWTMAAPMWKKLDAWLQQMSTPVTQKLIAAAGIRPGLRVLDIASGSGEPAIPIAAAVGSEGRVVATDLSESMLAVAREKASAKGLHNIDFHVVDGEALTGVSGPFDAATMRWGLMFMPDPAASLKRIHDLLVPGARIALTTWGPPPRTPFISLVMTVLMRHFEVPTPPPGTPGIFAFADDGRLRRTLEEAGFKDVSIEGLEVSSTYDSAQHYWDVQTQIAAPIRAMLDKVSDEQRQKVAAEVMTEVGRFRDGDGPGLRIPGLTWVATGVK